MSDEISKVNGTYLGKIFHKKGSKTKPDGTIKDWKQYKAQVRVGEKDWNFWCFETTKGLSECKEGEEYCVGYTVKEITGSDGTVYKLKNALWFGTPSTDITPAQEQPATSTPATTESNPAFTFGKGTGTSADEELFMKAYKENIQASDWSISHFVGTFYRTYVKGDSVERLKELFNSKVHNTKEVQKVVIEKDGDKE